MSFSHNNVIVQLGHPGNSVLIFLKRATVQAVGGQLDVNNTSNAFYALFHLRFSRCISRSCVFQFFHPLHHDLMRPKRWFDLKQLVHLLKRYAFRLGNQEVLSSQLCAHYLQVAGSVHLQRMVSTEASSRRRTYTHHTPL